jgi:hypothetical protein
LGKALDLVNKRFGKLTVIKRVENDENGRSRWLCLCDCGNYKEVTGKLLVNNHVRSCGCILSSITSKRCLNNLVGKRFGRLVVKNRADDYISPSGKHHVKWNCLCDCGNTISVDAGQLTSGKTKSCGCLKSDSKTHEKHGGRNERLYKVYANMKNRCYNKNSQDYKYYGGRGIVICDEWLNDYSVFREWAIMNGYDKYAKYGKCTIDRIDVNGNYSPNNCRWVDMKVQSLNRRNVKSK